MPTNSKLKVRQIWKVFARTNTFNLRKINKFNPLKIHLIGNQSLIVLKFDKSSRKFIKTFEKDGKNVCAADNREFWDMIQPTTVLV